MIDRGPYGFSSGLSQPYSSVQRTVIIWSVHVFWALVSALSGAGTALGVVVSEIVMRDASSGLRAEGTMCLMPACVKAEAVVGVVAPEAGPDAGGVIAAGVILKMMW